MDKQIPDKISIVSLWGDSIAEVKKTLDEAEKKVLEKYPSATNITLEVDTGYDNCIDYYLSFMRDRTSEETAEENKKIEEREEYERNQYERLKKKFETK